MNSNDYHVNKLVMKFISLCMNIRDTLLLSSESDVTYAPINVKPAGGGGRAWGRDLTFFENLPSNSLPTGKLFQSNAQKFPRPGRHIARTLIVRIGKKKRLRFSLSPFTSIPQYLKTCESTKKL